MNNHGDPRQVIISAPLLVKVKNVNGANSRSAVKAVESGCDRDGTVARFPQPKMTRNATNPAPGKRTQRPSATPSSGPPSDGMTIWLTRTASCAGGLNAPYHPA